MAANKLNSLTIASFNVNGINSFTRRQRIFSFLADKNFDVNFLQETHIHDPKTLEAAKKEMARQERLGPGSSFIKGVAVLFNSRLVFKILITFMTTNLVCSLK
jgi:exonuclease III